MPDSNGHLTEDEETCAAVMVEGGGLPEEHGGADGAGLVPAASSSSSSSSHWVEGQEGSMVQTKNWSDFNMVSAKSFGDQVGFGSFSDFLTELESPELGVVVGPQRYNHWNSVAGEEEEQQSAAVAAITKEVQQYQLFAAQQKGDEEGPQPTDSVEHAALGLQDHSQIAPAEPSGMENPYPGWYYDYQVSEWRQVEGGGGNPASATVNQEGNAFHNGETDPSNLPISKNEAEQVGVGQSEVREEGWASNNGAMQAQQYPGWTWDYQAQMWVQVPEPWQDSTGSAQKYGGEGTWYEQQESWQQQQQQQQSQYFYSQQESLQKQQPHSFYEQQENLKQQSQFHGEGYAPNASYAQTYAQVPSQWQNEQQFMNPTPFPQMNGAQSWGVASADGQQGSVMTHMQPSNMNYNYTSSAQTFSYPQQPWGSGNAHHQYGPRSSQSSSPPRSLYEALQTSVGRPPHSLATFGFGGKLLTMKLKDPVTLHTSNGDQVLPQHLFFEPIQSSIWVIARNLTRFGVVYGGQAIVSGQAWTPGPVQVQALNVYTGIANNWTGPLMGGGTSTKELYAWIDDCISSCSPQDSMRLLWGLLKIACQHYGKLRSLTVSSGISSKEEDGPEAALAKLLAASGANESAWTMGTLVYSQSLQLLPSEQQLQITALEMKKLLVAGKQKDALMCAQQGQLWGPALLLACQLGDKFYTETATEMAKAQFVEGSPLRTLCLLLAGQPADVFSGTSLPGAKHTMDTTGSSNNLSQVGVGAMLEEWQENLAIMAANHTAGDDRVILHLGDCLWRARGEVNAAHICYLVADATLESYSQSARLCLIGADHCKNPRTYVAVDAIQASLRTEIFEYAKVLGNPQFVLLPFQPYKLVYAAMLAEAGKTAEALRYCQAVLKTLKTAGRSPDMEACRVAATDLEDCLRMHIQDAHGSNLAPGKLVGRLFSTLDRGISRMIGGPPLSTTAEVPGYGMQRVEERNLSNQVQPGSSRGQRPPVPMAPAASVATSMERLPKEPKRYMSSRSYSEPDFSKSPKEGKAEGIPGSPSRVAAGGYHLGRLGSSILQKAVGLVSFTSHTTKAKLGDSNKFRYDEKLKRWVEEGVELPPEEPLPPPPISSNFVASTSPDTSHVTTQAISSKPGTPPIPPSSSTHSSRTRSHGVRSRYVDTFNTSASASASTLKPVLSPFVPAPIAGGGVTAMPTMFIPTPLPGPAMNETTNEIDNTTNDSTAFRSRDESTSVGTYLDTANSDNNITDTSHLPPPTSFTMLPGVPSSDSGFASPGHAPVSSSRRVAPTSSAEVRTRSASWDGYQTSFQPSHFPKGSGMAVPMDLSRDMLAQPYASSQGTESLAVEEMQEVEL
ncbi:unnamed protein product [Sphagnum troendelagicum]